MSRFISLPTVALTVGLVLSGSAIAAPEPAGRQVHTEDGPDVDTRADRILREMGEYLAGAQEYSFEADIAYDTETEEGQMLQYGGNAQVAVGRPDRLHVEYEGDERESLVIFDGETFTFYNARANLYATTAVPPKMDDALDRAFELYGFSVPIADLVYSDPYGTLIENVQEGTFIGRHPVGGIPCHHLAFSQESIDWQIWIEDGPQPVPRKLVITYKNEEGSPQYSARLSNWDFQPRFSAHFFRFHPPTGAGEIEFLPTQEVEGNQQ